MEWNERKNLREENKNNPNYPHVYWKNDTQLYVKIGDVEKIVTVEEAKKMFGDNILFMNELNFLLDAQSNKLGFRINDEPEVEYATVMGSSVKSSPNEDGIINELNEAEIEEEKAVLNNVKTKFAGAREKCPGMSEDVYALTDYISLVANDLLIPQGLVMCMASVMDDLQQGRNGFKNEPLPDYLNSRRNQILPQMVYIPQVVDAIAPEKFSEEFREICNLVFGFNPPKRVDSNVDSQYPENVIAAVDWWANAVQSPKLDNGTDINPLFMMMVSGKQKTHSEEEIKIFKDSLAKDILEELQNFERCSLSVDYHPCQILSRAGNKIGLNDTTDYPWKTYMHISEEIVEVSEDGADKQVIWTKKGLNDIISDDVQPGR